LTVEAAKKRRRSLWRRVRRATRGPRNAILARTIRLTVRLFGRLPLGIGLAIGRGLGSGAHRLLATPRRLALEHVGFALPEIDASARHALVRTTFRHAGESFAELALFEKIMRRSEYVRLEGVAALDAALAQGRGAIAVTGHVGNWELLAAWAAAIGYPITVVVRRVNDLRFHSLIVGFRAAAGVEILVRDAPDFVAGVTEALARNRVVAMLIDQDTRGAGVFVPFFGRPAHTPPGAAVLALRARVPVVTVFIERRPEGGHLVHVAGVAPVPRRGREGVRELTARLTAAIEAQIRRSPAEWVWWHERWRTEPPVAGARTAGARVRALR
jgi:Kdo2-lipid IVA lauroyltransferase/acyltransferase